MLVSIIIPVYNAEPYLPQCVESVLRQSVSDFELLLIDNNSRDRSAALCQHYAQQDARILCLSCLKPGASAARNCGLDHASGQLVVFIDADDWVESDHLQNLIDAKGGRAFGARSITFTNTVMPYKLELTEEETVGADCQRVIANLRRAAYFGWSCNKAFSRTLIEELHLRFDETMRIHEDELFTAQYCKHIDHLRVSNRKTYHYRILKTGLMRSAMPYQDRLYCYRRLYQTYSTMDDENRYLSARIHLSNCCHQLRHFWSVDDIRFAMMYVFGAWEEYSNLCRANFLRDRRDQKVAERAQYVFLVRKGWWVWFATKFINI